MPTRRDRGVAAHLLFSDRKAIARWHQHAPEHAESARVFEVCPLELSLAAAKILSAFRRDARMPASFVFKAFTLFRTFSFRPRLMRGGRLADGC